MKWKLLFIPLIVAAIAAHKPEAARAAMHRHLENSQQRFADAWPRATPANVAAQAA